MDDDFEPMPMPMQDSDWRIERQGRSWSAEEFRQRMDLTPEKLEAWDGKLLWDDDERVLLLGLLLENVGIDRAIRLGDPARWREAIAQL